MPGLKKQLVTEGGVSEGWEQGARSKGINGGCIMEKEQITVPVCFIHGIFQGLKT